MGKKLVSTLSDHISEFLYFKKKWNIFSVFLAKETDLLKRDGFWLLQSQFTYQLKPLKYLLKNHAFLVKKKKTWMMHYKNPRINSRKIYLNRAKQTSSKLLYNFISFWKNNLEHQNAKGEKYFLINSRNIFANLFVTTVVTNTGSSLVRIWTPCRTMKTKKKYKAFLYFRLLSYNLFGLCV